MEDPKVALHFFPTDAKAHVRQSYTHPRTWVIHWKRAFNFKAMTTVFGLNKYLSFPHTQNKTDSRWLSPVYILSLPVRQDEFHR